jgi:hypothetical protein
MNEQAEQKPMTEHSKSSNFEESVQDMIIRVIGIARLLVTDGPTAVDSPVESKRTRRKKHKNENS